MVIAVAYKDNEIYEHFGHAEHFAIYETNEDQTQLISKNIIEVKESGHQAVADLMNENHVDVAVLCVPKKHAVAITELLTSHGINAIWNFTNVELTAPESSTIVENIHFSDSLLSLSYFVAQDIDEKAARAARLNK